ncbi:MAG TPA: adenylate/guanylate cyclase domain-containing protein [Solirubrobacteraceae bacterium]|nr:adenylate/guanylate cyclase domain-containing protein [Solirubrobacteraceae bacterium]
MSQEPDHDAQTAWSALREAAARLDSEPRVLEALRTLRRRLPGDEKFGDPLSTGGNTTVAYMARSISGRQAERDSALGELGLTGLQLWQSLSEGVGRGRGEQELALLFTDLVDFSSWVLAAGDAAAVNVLRAVADAVDQPILDRGGRIHKRLGDGLLATFIDASDAVAAALEAQGALAKVDVDGYRPQMRAGVHWGRPRRLGGDYLGQDVSIAAAVGANAAAGQVLVSAPVLAHLDRRPSRLSISPLRRLRTSSVPADLEVADVSSD